MNSTVMGLLLAALCLGQPPAKAPSDYVLGQGDEILVRVPDADEINDTVIRIDLSGNIKLAMAGRVKAAGLTAEQLETAIGRRLERYIQRPEVSVMVKEFHSQPVSVLGAVQQPGVHQLRGLKTLFEILSMAGGLRAEAGSTIKITRHKQWGPIPLSNAREDPSGKFSVAQVSVRSVMEAKKPEENIQVMPHDVISVPKGDMVYVIGSVKRAGGFMLNERENATVLQALSLAEGLERLAAPKSAKILRPSPGASMRTEIPVDISAILAGRSADVLLHSDDILFVPNNTGKSVALRTVEAAIYTGTGIAIFRRY